MTLFNSNGKISGSWTSQDDTPSNKTLSNSYILHIDGDGFFASCEVSRKPELWGKPVVVGEERGIATALTYEAKALGVKRGDPVFKIRRDYPSVKILSSHFELYRFYNKNLTEILKPLVDKIEVYSIDECFAEISGTEENIKDKVSLIKKMVQSKLGITYSFGVSITKTLAKVASKRNKPNGLCILLNGKDIDEALKSTKIGSVWGIGFQTEKKLLNKKINTAYDFINCDATSILKDSFTKPSQITFEELCGVKHLEVGDNHEHKKSIQATRSFGERSTNRDFIKSELFRNLEVLCGELNDNKLYTNRILFFIDKHRKNYLGKSFSAVVDLPNYLRASTSISKHIEQAFDMFEVDHNTLYNKTGLMALNLKSSDEIPDDLFGHSNVVLDNEDKMQNILNKIRNKYGYESIQLAASLDAQIQRGMNRADRDVKDDYIYGLPYPFLGVIK